MWHRCPPGSAWGTKSTAEKGAPLSNESKSSDQIRDPRQQINLKQNSLIPACLPSPVSRNRDIIGAWRIVALSMRRFTHQRAKPTTRCANPWSKHVQSSPDPCADNPHHLIILEFIYSTPSQAIDTASCIDRWHVTCDVEPSMPSNSCCVPVAVKVSSAPYNNRAPVFIRPSCVKEVSGVTNRERKSNVAVDRPYTDETKERKCISRHDQE